MDIIGIGKTVMIKTNHGEIYSAYISLIDRTTNLVTLVWFQDGQTNSKEITMSQALNEPIILIDDYYNQVNNLNINSNLIKNISRNKKKYYNDIEQFKSDTKIDSYHNIKPTSCCSVLINELKEHGKNISLTNNNISESLYESTDDLFDDNKSLHSCHCPESEASFKSKLSLIDTTLNLLNTNGNIEKPTRTIVYDLIPQDTKADIIPDQLHIKNSIDISDNSMLSSASTLQESFKFTLRKREEELQKKILSTQILRRKKNKLITLDLGDPSKDTLAMIRECKTALKYQQLGNDAPIDTHPIMVCVRKRPLQLSETLQNDIDIISIPNKDLVIVHELKTKVNLRKYLENHKFRFDYGFDETCNNEIVYNYTAKPLIQTLFDGGMATCFAYGQTGAGKTYTVGGNYKNGKTSCEDGICALAAKDVFIKLKESKHNNLHVSASFYEIYNGKVYDLLSDKKLLSVLEDGKHKVNIVGLTEKVVTQYDDVLHLIEYGNNIRTSGETSANKHSSRSHAVFQIILRRPNISKVYGKFSFIDLAGNERGCDSITTNRYEMLEAAGINTSLLALKECIRAMGKDKAHLPFRASKLTQVLKDSFVAKKSRTCMIAMISPGLNSCQYTLNTLRYADRVKELAVRDEVKKFKKIIPKIITKNNQFACKCVPRY